MKCSKCRKDSVCFLFYKGKLIPMCLECALRYQEEIDSGAVFYQLVPYDPTSERIQYQIISSVTGGAY